MIEVKHQKELEKIVGSENFYNDKAHLIAYCYDATKERYEPDCIIYPRNESDVSKILKYCNTHKISVLPRGGGSGFTGGALPVNGGVVLAMEKHFNQILEIDEKNLIARVQPAVINKHFQEVVEKIGLFYPPDPASQEYCTLGGNVSENAGGMRAAKYGITKDYVMAIRAVLPNGEIIRAGKKTIKDVAGYNVAGILIASEGSLAVITEITLKLIAKPKISKSAMGVFSDIQSAMNAVYKTMAGGVTPVAMEFLDNLSIRAVEEKFHKNLPIEAGAILITQVDGDIPEQIKWQLEKIQEKFTENGCIDFKIAQSKEEEENLWFARRNASQSITVYGKKKLNEDITVPRSRLPELLEKISIVSKKYGFKIPCFGHTGDGNVHTNVMVPDDKDEEQLKRGHQAIEEIFKIAIELEGTLSGEHGIGLSKAPFMSLAFTPAEMELFRSIKRAFDPNNILNTGKMGL
ncbi:FAD-linked oxidase C-terminal domain-containing protein [Helicobacter sp. faydin-H76]|uniref:FAD-linked oxidase C-terminal domain-containing protein n=1 Tax=Helicobacter cappadocius TaxID=3063998 RepID=A0AA90PJL1_9HELI|nr:MULTISPECIES: FAD-linked oxidase C-terminal domain-containing protein [unclassified Helicobacter]MDO7252924.1 FAD-linked oxidase C-terminal domain-containing protein [Helicobacter sp. faydin-H75]MDP2539086.1 FAD-linked oxidase C-terminal domain-containing protein [Helicobacter sp. faydin-H76]